LGFVSFALVRLRCWLFARKLAPGFVTNFSIDIDLTTDVGELYSEETRPIILSNVLADATSRLHNYHSSADDFECSYQVLVFNFIKSRYIKCNSTN